MTVESLVAQMLNLMAHGLSGKAVVKAFNGDSGHLEEVTGFLYDNEQVEICTDDND